MAVAGEAVRCVVKGVDVRAPAREALVVLRLGSVIRLFEAPCDVRVVVRLMNRGDHPSCIQDRASLPGAPHEPVVEARTTDQKWRQVSELPCREDEIVESCVPPQPSVGKSTLPQLIAVARVAEGRTRLDP